MGVADLYSGGFPSCGLGDPDPLKWFPSADTCNSDPDWTACGLASCPDLTGWNAHILGAHYPLDLEYLGNHCRDGRQDYGETGPDSGGSCIYP
jgi:hypothetical protein